MLLHSIIYRLMNRFNTKGKVKDQVIKEVIEDSKHAESSEDSSIEIISVKNFAFPKPQNRKNMNATNQKQENENDEKSANLAIDVVSHIISDSASDDNKSKSFKRIYQKLSSEQKSK